MLASGEISRDSLVRSWPGNREEVERRGTTNGDKKKSQKSREYVLFWRAVGHPWSGASTFG